MKVLAFSPLSLLSLHWIHRFISPDLQLTPGASSNDDYDIHQSQSLPPLSVFQTTTFLFFFLSYLLWGCNHPFFIQFLPARLDFVRCGGVLDWRPCPSFVCQSAVSHASIYIVSWYSSCDSYFIRSSFTVVSRLCLGQHDDNGDSDKYWIFHCIVYYNCCVWGLVNSLNAWDFDFKAFFWTIFLMRPKSKWCVTWTKIRAGPQGTVTRDWRINRNGTVI